MKIAIIGYGKMGRMLEELAPEQGLEVVSVIDPVVKEANYKNISAEAVKDADVCIDFTHPSTAVANITQLAKLGKNVVVGTTGWYDDIDKVRAIVEDAGIGLIWSGNFSIGVNIFFEITKFTSRIMNQIKDYDPYVLELHHNQKADSPSGTAHMLGEMVIDNIDRKKKIVDDALRRKIGEDELHVASVRAGSITGTHEVGFDSEADIIKLVHVAKNRKGFATGALLAAKWIKGKEGFFNIEDMMKNIIGGK